MNKQLLSDLKNNPKKLYYVVNNIFSIKELMGEVQEKNIYCPFHGESKAAGSKPSARFYTNVSPIKLWCFQEHKSYYAYHYIKLIMKLDPLSYLISNASEKKINYYVEEYNEKTEEEFNKLNISSLEELDLMYKTIEVNNDYSKWYIV